MSDGCHVDDVDGAGDVGREPIFSRFLYNTFSIFVFSRFAHDNFSTVFFLYVVPTWVSTSFGGRKVIMADPVVSQWVC